MRLICATRRANPEKNFPELGLPFAQTVKLTGLSKLKVDTTTQKNLNSSLSFGHAALTFCFNLAHWAIES